MLVSSPRNYYIWLSWERREERGTMHGQLFRWNVVKVCPSFCRHPAPLLNPLNWKNSLVFCLPLTTIDQLCPPPGNKCGCWLLLCYPAKLNRFMLMILKLGSFSWLYELKISSETRHVIKFVKNCMHRQIALLQTSKLPSKCRWKWTGRQS